MVEPPAGSRPRQLLELFVLCGFVVVQPVLDVMGRSPDFFLFNGAGRREVVSLGLLVATVPPLVLWGIEQAVGLAGDRIRHWTHAWLVAVLVGLLGVQVLKRATGARDGALVVLTILVALGAAALYLRVTSVRLLLRYLIPAPVVFLALFLFGSQVSALVLPSPSAEATSSAGGGAEIPVVVLLLDELPLNALLRADGTIDAELFPNFATLAAGSTWYRNATGVSGFTPFAVPAMLTGRHPTQRLAPAASQFPQNLFTLLGDSHDMRVTESITDLCPGSVCPPVPGTVDAAGFGTLVGEAASLWRDLVAPGDVTADPAASLEEETGPQPRGADDVDFLFGMEQRQPLRWTAFLTNLGRLAVDGVPKPPFHFLHLLLPHQPWQYLPSGVRYNGMNLGKDNGPQWFGEQWPVTVSHQRLLLQLAWLDGLLGQLIGRLQETGLWDRAAIVVTADHGIAFRAGDFARRASDQQAHEAMWVPFFLRAPGLPVGAVDDRNVEMVDLAPTIAQLVGADVPWETDGRSVLGEPRTETTKSFAHRPGEPVVVDGATWFPRVLDGAVDRLLAAGGGRDRLYRLLPQGDLVGLPVEQFELVAPTGAAAQIDQAGAFASVGDDDAIPALVTGRLVSPGSGPPASVAFALNGRIAAVSERYGGDQVAAMLAESAFVEGPNRLEVFLVRRLSDRATLEPVELR